MGKPQKKDIIRPICPFCSTPWTDDMVKVEAYQASAGCDTCGHGSEIAGTVTIRCDGCKKVIYQKEFSS